MNKFLLAAAAAAVTLGLGVANAAEGVSVPKNSWSFSGIFGTFDEAQLQRGFQVYKEVCSGCHSLNLVAVRNLADLGYNEDELKALAAGYEVTDGPNEDGEMFERPGRPSDYFPAPFPNANAAAASNGGAEPPDLSLMAKARAGGPNYIKALLTGYEGGVPATVLQSIFELETHKRKVKYDAEFSVYQAKKKAYDDKLEADPSLASDPMVKEPVKPADMVPVESVEDLGLPETSSFNAYFPGYGIAMAAPLGDDAVEYGDGTPADLENLSADVSAFLMWAAEPSMGQRKEMGIKVMLFLLVFSGVLYAAKRKCWADVH
jgi:cytochrome c1